MLLSTSLRSIPIFFNFYRQCTHIALIQWCWKVQNSLFRGCPLSRQRYTVAVSNCSLYMNHCELHNTRIKLECIHTAFLYSKSWTGATYLSGAPELTPYFKLGSLLLCVGFVHRSLSFLARLLHCLQIILIDLSLNIWTHCISKRGVYLMNR
jgi:hypothetical protein